MRTKLALITFVLLLTDALKLHAQEIGECGNTTDPDNSACPLDSWIYVLVFAAAIFVSFHLYRKQKAALNRP
jgi:hypothetical protein